MSRGRPKLTPERLAHAQRLYAEGRNYREISKELGLSGSTMARIWLDPGYAEYRRQRVRQYRRGFAVSPVTVDRWQIAEAAARLMAEIPPDTRDLTGRIFGDPLPGRRAIDKMEMRRGKYEVPFQ